MAQPLDIEVLLFLLDRSVVVGVFFAFDSQLSLYLLCYLLLGGFKRLG
jgi:hypothetical protein